MDDQNNFTPVTPVVPPMPEMPMPGPITTSTTTSTPTSTTTSTTTTTPPTPDLSPVLPMAPEVEWPGSKPKSKLPQILGGIAAIILVVGVATAAYFVSNRISGRQAVAPTAPESEPLAKGGGGTIGGTPTKAPVAEKTTGLSGAKAGVTAGGGTSTSTSKGTSVGGGVSTGLSGAKAGVTAGGSGSTGLSGAKAGVTSGKSDDDSERTGLSGGAAGTTAAVCTEGATSCADNHKYVCSGGKWIADGPCTTATGTTTTTTSGGGTGGTTTTTTTTKKTGGGEGGSGAQSATSCTEQCPGGDGVLRSCTPPEADGSSYDSLCNSAGRVEVCGGNNYCCPTAGGTWTTNMAACPTGTAVTAGACTLVNIYKKVDETSYGTTPLTTAELQTLKVGDVLQFYLVSNADNLKGRFRVTISGIAGNWLDGTIDSSKRNIFYPGYTITTPGTYRFEGQVTTEP